MSEDQENYNEIRHPYLPDRPKQFKSLKQLRDWIGKLKKTDWRKVAKDRMKDHPISVAPFEDREKYLNYCISLLDHRPEHKKLLTFMMIAMRYGKDREDCITFIAEKIRQPREVVELREREAIAYVQEAIDEKKMNGIPLVGGAHA